MNSFKQSAKVTGELIFHILYHDLDKLDRNEAEDKIACDILGGFLPPLDQLEVDMAFEVSADYRKEYSANT